MIIKSNIILDAWKQTLAYIIKRGKDFTDENQRICREVLNLLIRVRNPQADITKPIEMLNRFQHWKYPPLEEIAQIMLAKKLAPEYAYSYGPRIFNFQNRVNQVDEFVIPLLKEVPNSRRAILTFIDPIQDFNILKRDTPALTTIDFKLRANRLHMTAIIRSNDLFFGWPANVYQLFVLQEHIRKKLGCEGGSLNTFSTSAHIFRDQFKYIKEILKSSKEESCEPAF